MLDADPLIGRGDDLAAVTTEETGHERRATAAGGADRENAPRAAIVEELPELAEIVLHRSEERDAIHQPEQIVDRPAFSLVRHTERSAVARARAQGERNGSSRAAGAASSGQNLTIPSPKLPW